MTSAAIPGSGRLLAIDAARGLALVGMIIVNVGPVAAESGWHRLWLAPYGRASILFVVVAGISMSLFLRPGRAGRRTLVVLWRAGVLLAGGLLLGLLPHGVNVILPLYGALFLAALVLCWLPSWALIVIATVFAALGPVLFVGETLDHAGDGGFALRWDAGARDLLHTLFLTRPYPFIVWIVPFILGMLLGRVGLSSRRNQKKMIWSGAAAAVAGLAASEVLTAAYGPFESGYGMLLTGTPHGQMPLWLLSSLGSATLALGLLLYFWNKIETVARPLVLAGQMALTPYVVHLVALAVLRPEEGFGFPEGIGMSLVLIAGCLAAAVLWRRFFRLGPLEWVLKARWLELPPRRETLSTRDSRRMRQITTE
ncbi:DUF418 domain-containing protein [Microbacterium maritypicum]|uniref:DUF418 domain-containing protein n=1 Tax=Microbacterium maritypicum TaxID=33918 RepID=UPI0026717516|nr:DUF418 domain-containing protein [Microbacterium liquefaciens]WKT89582.1 DUF418 domain-containing protein [Microbacterium liquefaciens]